MKKVLLILMVLLCAVLLTACGCDHEHTELRDAVAPTCTEKGFSGNTFCLDCNKVIANGEAMPALGHGESVLEDAVEASCSMEGYTGDLRCTRCKEILEQGSVVETLEHTPEVRFVYKATCTLDGYTGDTYCTVCNAWLGTGESIPATGHTAGEILNAAEATCRVAGYTGDFICLNCDRKIMGENIEKLPHNFENGVCTACGWRTSGIYLSDQSEPDFSWQKCLDNGYITLDKEGRIIEIAAGIKGTLVIDESVTAFNSKATFRNSSLTEIWVPSTITAIGTPLSGSKTLQRAVFFGENIEFKDAAFRDDVALTEVTFKGAVHFFSSYTFSECTSLESIVLPQVSSLPAHLFRNCTALRSVTLPDTLQSIGSYAFECCTALTGIELPDSLTTIDDCAFVSSGIEQITLPASLTSIDRYAFADCQKLVSMDMSATQVTELEDYTFDGCTALTEIKLPSTLLTIDHWVFSNCSSMTTLALPASLQSCKDSAFNNYKTNVSTLTMVVVPATLHDISAFSAENCASLNTVNFRGTEAEWSMIAGTDKLAKDVTVTFNYAE